MSDESLLEFALRYADLTEAAQSALRLEFSARSLEPPIINTEELDEASYPSQALVTVATYRDLAEAVVARSVLQAEHIECFLLDENTIRQDWLWSNLLGGMRLQVFVEDEAAARSLLTQSPPDRMEVAGESDFEQPVCPNCGSIQVYLNDPDRKILALSLLIALPLPHRKSAKETWKCDRCGCKWHDDGLTDLNPEP